MHTNSAQIPMFHVLHHAMAGWRCMDQCKIALRRSTVQRGGVRFLEKKSYITREWSLKYIKHVDVFQIVFIILGMLMSFSILKLATRIFFCQYNFIFYDERLPFFASRPTLTFIVFFSHRHCLHCTKDLFLVLR